MALVLCVLLTTTGCLWFGTSANTGPQKWVGAPLPEIAPQAWDARGTLVSQEPLTDLEAVVADEIGQSVKAVYRSVSAYDGQGSEVSGTFFAPEGDPPDGGWPVISFAHGTTGITEDCGPSLYPDLKGYAEGVASLVKQGYAVAMTDFQGLGHPGGHPYLEPRTEGFNVIDAVRALQNVFPGKVSNRWMTVGGSQGGQAAWAANEYAVDYGEGLDLVGSVAVAPAADISGFGERAKIGQLTPSQIVFMPLVIAGLKVVDPTLNEADYLRGTAAEQQIALGSCGNVDKEAIWSQLTMEQVKPATPEAADRLTALLDANKLPQRTLTAPMLVVNGSDDDLILPQWVSAAISRACSMGGTIQHIEVKGQGHTDVSAGDETYKWMNDRFEGEQAPSTCADQ